MELLFWVVMGGFLGIRLFAAGYNLFFLPIPSQGFSDEIAPVSVLIPARNEALNLPKVLDQLLALSPPPLEIIVLNDGSEDDTESILKSYASTHPSIDYINGKPLPDGWLGKHWACHQLGQVAQGDYFLYLDADIAYLHPGLLGRMIPEMSKLQTALISIFPDQMMVSFGEKLTVPIMHYLLLSLLPLWWIYRLPFPAMAAANGQFMLFEASAYRQHQWHQQVRTIIVEDIAIMQRVKAAGLKGMTFVGDGLIRCRMYTSYEEGLAGFSKNILSGFGNSVPGLLVYLTLIGWGWLGLAWLYWPPNAWWVATILAILCIRGMVSYLAKQSVWENLWLHPLQMLTLIRIGFLSIRKKINGKNEWKGRNVQLPTS